MSKNVEMKAKVVNLEPIRQILNREPNETLHQKDIFINFNKGRLKLRESDVSMPQLIYYEREDSLNPKLSSFKIHTYRTKERYLKALKNYKKKYGIKGIVEKEREYFRIDNIRVHLDKVKELGEFVEIELILKDESNKSQNTEKAIDFFLNFLNIPKEDIIATSYIDLIQ